MKCENVLVREGKVLEQKMVCTAKGKLKFITDGMQTRMKCENDYTTILSAKEEKRWITVK